MLFWYAVCPILLTSCILRHYYLHFTDEETQAQTQRASFRRSGHGNRDDMGGGETADQTPLGYVSLSSYVRFVLTIYRKTHTHTNPIRFGIFNLGHSVHSEGDQTWDFFGRNDAKAETPVLWPPHVKS